ncbi:MAG: HAMP domain-containing sensor histidine kinase [Patescibacteria group bacterium]
MISFFTRSITRGVKFVRENPGLLYSLFLLLIIPVLFLFIANQFLTLATDNQERIERENIGLTQDIFSRFVQDEFSSPERIQFHLEGVGKQNTYIRELKVVSWEAGTPKVIASLSLEEVGKIDQENLAFYQATVLNTEASFIFEGVTPSGERYWKVIRSVSDGGGGVLGFVYSNLSMARVDAISSYNIRIAYAMLLVVVALTFLLLLRHARIVDYSTLYRKLEEVDKMKDDFVSMAAHELRTPLALIRNYAELISHTKDLSEENQKSLANIDLFARNLNTLIEDMLNTSKFEQGKIPFVMKLVDVKDAVYEAGEMFREVAKERGLFFRVKASDETCVINADKEKLHEVLVNLIGNSMKYTLSGGITVFVSKNSQKIEIRVSDTGVGISAEDQKKLFGKFVRIKLKETAEVGGTGLGLWITRAFIEGMGGEITVESIRGKGSDFVVAFPVPKKV